MAQIGEVTAALAASGEEEEAELLGLLRVLKRRRADLERASTAPASVPLTVERDGEPYGQGRGVLVRTGYGDGTYPVFATMVEDPLAPGSFRVGAVTIEFVGDA